MRHLAGADCQRKLAAAGVVFPALAGLGEQALAVHRQRGVDAGAFVEVARGQTFAPLIVENAAEIDQIIGHATENVLLGRAEVGTALRAANAKARALARP